jgi:hypothetical protein
MKGRGREGVGIHEHIVMKMKLEFYRRAEVEVVKGD